MSWDRDAQSKSDNRMLGRNVWESGTVAFGLAVVGAVLLIYDKELDGKPTIDDAGVLGVGLAALAVIALLRGYMHKIFKGPPNN